jgi:hypothetical protein
MAITYSKWALKIPTFTIQRPSKFGEPLWLSGKVMESENHQKEKIPGFTPNPGQPFFQKGNPKFTQFFFFWFENMPSGNPGADVRAMFIEIHLRYQKP